ncbi:MAG: hypothetical protein LBN07_00720 [Christensenellaceae bacterium]|nr:hypothetical protein [Christensenellaceae bacterium]
MKKKVMVEFFLGMSMILILGAVIYFSVTEVKLWLTFQDFYSNAERLEIAQYIPSVAWIIVAFVGAALILANLILLCLPKIKREFVYTLFGIIGILSTVFIVLQVIGGTAFVQYLDGLLHGIEEDAVLFNAETHVVYYTNFVGLLIAACVCGFANDGWQCKSR